MTPLQEIRLRENVWVFTLGGDRIETSYGANCTAVIGRDSVLVVDPLIAPAFARLVDDSLRAKTTLPVSHVVLTHHHTDHALGASWFAARGAAIAAHRACREAMAKEHPGLVAARRRIPQLAELFRDAEPHLPGRLIEGSVSIDLGGTFPRVFHPGRGHTAGDLVVHLETESLVVCGDLISVGYHVNYEDAAVLDLQAGLDTLLGLEARTYVPGHGPAGGTEIVSAQFLYHAAARSAASPEELRARYPDYLLSEILPQSVQAWRKAL